MSHVAPPDEHVGILQQFDRKPVLRLVKKRGPNIQVRLTTEKRRYGFMDAIRIDSRDLWIRLLVAELVPDSDLLGHVHGGWWMGKRKATETQGDFRASVAFCEKSGRSAGFAVNFHFDVMVHLV